MWWPEFKTGHVGLSAQRVSFARTGWLRSGKPLACEEVLLSPESQVQTSDMQPWRPAVAALTQWLDQHRGSMSSLQVVLSGRFVRWQLMPWRPELTGANERAAYASLRFQETFGKVALGWRVLQSLQPPGRAVVACAVDVALLETLAAICSDHMVRLASVKPYFSCAFDRWQASVKPLTVWFGVVEPDSLTLGLLQHGNWLGLRSQLMSGDWRETLPGMMAQVSITGGLSVIDADKPVPLYLAGNRDAPSVLNDLPFTWLEPQRLVHHGSKPVSINSRLAMGI